MFFSARKLLFASFILIALIFVKPATVLAAASMSLSPASGNYTVDSTLSVSVKVNTGGENINQVKANLSYPSTLLEFQSANKTASFITNWLIEDSSTPGILNYVGGLPTPGYNGTGTFITFNFRVKAAGAPTINLTTSSYVYKDIPGSTSTLNILDENSLAGGSYTLTSAGAGADSGAGAGGPVATATPTPSQLADAGVFDNTLILATFGLVLIFLGSFFRFRPLF